MHSLITNFTLIPVASGRLQKSHRLIPRLERTSSVPKPQSSLTAQRRLGNSPSPLFCLRYCPLMGGRNNQGCQVELTMIDAIPTGLLPQKIPFFDICR
ncbi:hypothetical protein AVEN_9609-1 [Araneus ventricosus]|uniref:Uncharacterized protein n=1 Tax=Araneus ventricosus TaxID=182803 RepID=A0A4Y2KSZ8_ARAVE|nr:hypothetical protein AVEN_9609-1 [Araneus ventricosus]